jgi:hypothetical protein
MAIPKVGRHSALLRDDSQRSRQIQAMARITISRLSLGSKTETA